MRPDEIRNAKIVKTFLGVEDHGFFILTVTLRYDGNQEQGYSRVLGKGNADTTTEIHRILDAVGVDSWEQLKGRYVRAFIEDGFIQALGNIVENNWTDGESR